MRHVIELLSHSGPNRDALARVGGKLAAFLIAMLCTLRRAIRSIRMPRWQVLCMPARITGAASCMGTVSAPEAGCIALTRVVTPGLFAPVCLASSLVMAGFGVAGLATGGTLGHAIDDGLLRIGGTGSTLQYVRDMSAQVASSEDNVLINVYPGLGSEGALKALQDGAIDIAMVRRPLRVAEINAGLMSIPLMETPFAFFTSIEDPGSISSNTIWRLFDGIGEPNPALGRQNLRVILRPPSDSDRRYASGAFPGLGATMDDASEYPGIVIARTDQENADIAEKVPNSLTTGTLLQMRAEKRDLRPIRINGVPPSVRSIEAGTYPYKIIIYLVYHRSRGELVNRFTRFLLSPEGVRIARDLGANVLH